MSLCDIGLHARHTTVWALGMGFVAAAFTADLANGSVVAAWNLNGVNPAQSTLFNATTGTGTIDFSGFGAGATVLQGTTLGGQTGELAGDSLAALGTISNNSSMRVDFQTVGYLDLVLNFATRRSATGAAANRVEYWTASGWVTAAKFTSNATAWELVSLKLAAGDFLANGSASLRFVVDGATGSTGSIRFDNIDFEWDQTIFEAESGSVPRQPQETATAGGDQQSAATNSITLGMPRRPAEPTVEPMKAQRWLCLPDPGTWSARSSAVQAHVATLRAAGQTTAGFQGLMRDGERRLLIVPFRAMDGAPPFAPPADWDVREIPSGRALVVYPPHGDFSERTKVGEAMLQNAIAALQLTATGPALAQPYLHLDEAEPDAAALAAPVVRISVLVQ